MLYNAIYPKQKDGAPLGRQIVDGATDTAIISTDIKGRITSWNLGAERLLGWTEAEMIACGEFDGLRFGVLLVAPEARLREVVGTDQNRAVIDRFDLRGDEAPGTGPNRES